MNCSLEKSVALEALMPLIKERLASGQSVRLEPKGTSMLPMLLKKYDLPLYQRTDGSYVLHRVVGVGESYTCMGDNQFKPEPGLRHEQMIALVSAFSRGDREYSVSHPAYRLYCRLWHWSRPLRRIWRGAKNRLSRMLK